jgi:hypothetical protein
MSFDIVEYSSMLWLWDELFAFDQSIATSDFSSPFASNNARGYVYVETQNLNKKLVGPFQDMEWKVSLASNIPTFVRQTLNKNNELN